MPNDMNKPNKQQNPASDKQRTGLDKDIQRGDKQRDQNERNVNRDDL